ncbi:cytochrome P450 4C1-like isoform X2 [Periplaneta americana]
MDADTVSVLLGLLTAVTLLLVLRRSYRSRLVRLVNRLPGPPAYPIVGTMLPFILAPRRDLMRKLLEENDKYQPLFRTWLGGMPEVNLLKPEFVETVLGSSKHLDKASSYKFLEPWLGTGLLTSTGSKWHSHRKLITPTFHFKILDNFVEVFSEKSEILVNKLKKEIGSQGFDVYPYITRCALDIICETAMGTPVHAQEDSESDYVTAVYDMSELSIHRMFRPWLYPDWIFNLSPAGRRHNQCLRTLHEFTKRVIQERKQLHEKSQKKPETSAESEDDTLGKKKRKAFLDLLLEASHDGVSLTDEELREEVDTFMFEGHDTTSAAICWTILLLGLHPEIQNRAYEELEEIFQGSDRAPTMKDLTELKYLERVIKESLRLYPSVPMIGRELKEDVQIGSYTIPRGVTATTHIYSIHRNPDHFPNPEVFDPDNFLPERVANRHPYAYIPFSAGPRNCIGQKFALLEEKTMLAYILRNYEVRSLDKMEDVNLMVELILRPEKEIRIIIESRKRSVS